MKFQRIGLSPSSTESSSSISYNSYAYVPPLNSPFYHHVISPFCNIIIQYHLIPRWVTPNQISFVGLLFAVLAVICAKLKYYGYAAPFWMLYGLFDNLDGERESLPMYLETVFIPFDEVFMAVHCNMSGNTTERCLVSPPQENKPVLQTHHQRVVILSIMQLIQL